MAKHGHIHTRFNALKESYRPFIHKGNKLLMFASNPPFWAFLGYLANVTYRTLSF